MKLYGGIDLHSNNSVIALSDDEDKVVYRRRLANDLQIVLPELAPYADAIEGLVVESTYNWYWLVDGLMEAGYRVHLANTAAIVQYAGLKYADDDSDACWLAKLLRLGLLPEGYIYPKEERPVRDLFRKRSQLVHQRTSNLQSIQNLMARNRGHSLSANQIKRLSYEDVYRLLPDIDLALALKSTLAVMRTLDGAIALLEKRVKARIGLRPAFKPLLTVSGIGQILGLTIMLETGEIGRFPKVGN
ncbi:MAG: transposase [Pseudomonadota bacterium]|nr:transposase [Pseudomonadota bacterium]